MTLYNIYYISFEIIKSLIWRKSTERFFWACWLKSLLEVEVGLPRFELKSIAPEATRMPSYPTGPKLGVT